MAISDTLEGLPLLNKLFKQHQQKQKNEKCEEGQAEGQVFLQQQQQHQQQQSNAIQQQGQTNVIDQQQVIPGQQKQNTSSQQQKIIVTKQQQKLQQQWEDKQSQIINQHIQQLTSEQIQALS